MVQRVSGLPAGLLSLVGNNSMGVNPADLGDVIAPVVELSDLYLLAFQTVVSTNVNPLLAGPNTGAVNLTVPTGERWFIHSIDAAVFAVAGASADISAAMVQDGVTSMLTSSLVVPVNTTRFISAQPRVWIPAGAALRMYGASIVGAPIGGLTAVISKLRM